VLEVFWKDFGNEQFRLMDQERPTMRLPGNDIRKSFVFGLLHHSMKHCWERMMDSTS
jgi:hypothetical protein